MERPRILISRGRLPAKAYSDRIREAGAEPIEIAAGDPIPAFDALCLSGGPDVDPARYGQDRNGSEDPDRPRDALELDDLLPRALSGGRPVLAICRGSQVLNVFRGGTLIQHIGEQHRAKHDEVKPHSIRTDPGSRLAEICGPSLVVNSRHHQVIDRLGEGLRASAWSDDLIEGVELPQAEWVVGVQWHPERVQDRIPGNGAEVFEAFVEAARRVPAR